MNIRYRPSIDPGGGAASASTDAMTAYGRQLVKPPADRRHHSATEPKMPLVASIASANINGSKQPPPASPHCPAQSHSPRAGAATQIP
jgi:hypothetical protein